MLAMTMRGGAVGDRYGRRSDDSAFSQWIIAVRWGALCAACFVLGCLSVGATSNDLKTILPSFAGGMVGATVCLFGIGKPLFDLLKSNSEAQIAELRKDLDAEMEARAVSERNNAAMIEELTKRNDALQHALTLSGAVK